MGRVGRWVKRTDGDVGPADALLTRFALNTHSESLGIEKGMNRERRKEMVGERGTRKGCDRRQQPF